MPHCWKSHVVAHIVGAQKNCLIETVCLSTHNMSCEYQQDMFLFGNKGDISELRFHLESIVFTFIQ